MSIFVSSLSYLSFSNNLWSGYLLDACIAQEGS